MFEQVPGRGADPEVIARFDELFERRYQTTTPDAAWLVDRVCSAWRSENRAAAAQLAAIGELFAYRLSRCSENEAWAIDTLEAGRGAADRSGTGREPAALCPGHA